MIKHCLEKEIGTLQDRLTANQRAWEVSQQELNHLKKCSNEKEGSLKSILEEAKAEKNRHNAFQEQIIRLLRNNSISVAPSNKAIVEKIREMCLGEENQKIVREYLF